MAPRRLELSHEWGSFAIRDVETGDRVDPGSLGMPDSVVERLNAWSARWDTTFDVDRPNVPKVDSWVIQELALDGARLWRAMLGVLSPQRYQVSYRHEEVLYRKVEELPDRWRLG